MKTELDQLIEAINRFVGSQRIAAPALSDQPTCNVVVNIPDSYNAERIREFIEAIGDRDKSLGIRTGRLAS